MCDVFCHGVSRKEENQLFLPCPSFFYSPSFILIAFNFFPYTFLQYVSLKIPPPFDANTLS